ncbi:unnamed protein product [Somion occarium]|uniref:BAG domain-containing protein n=1 Tax=Somion occarium TaxID=3059160 RepID=A0ABP1DLV7_9APHY
MSYVVKWGRERLHFPLPPPNAKLAAIRKQIAEYTQLPENSFKLVHAGAVMKDDNAPISAYGIKENSTLAIIGGGEHGVEEFKAKIPISTKTAQRRTEETTISQIRTELDKVRQNLQPDVDSFLSTLKPPQAAPTSPTTTDSPQPAHVGNAISGKKPKEMEQEHARLGELLLQSLLRLDAINAEGEWEDARKERKGAVREVQSLLDRLDGGWKASRSKA